MPVLLSLNVEKAKQSVKAKVLHTVATWLMSGESKVCYSLASEIIIPSLQSIIFISLIIAKYSISFSMMTVDN